MLRSLLMAMVLASGALMGASRAADLNDCPTDARADFVFGCMKANGDTHDALERCSCAIDVIATILPYKAYEKGETVASLDLDHGWIGSTARVPRRKCAAFRVSRRPGFS